MSNEDIPIFDYTRFFICPDCNKDVPGRERCPGKIELQLHHRLNYPPYTDCKGSNVYYDIGVLPEFTYEQLEEQAKIIRELEEREKKLKKNNK